MDSMKKHEWLMVFFEITRLIEELYGQQPMICQIIRFSGYISYVFLTFRLKKR